MRALRTASSTSPRLSPRFGTSTCTRRSARAESHASSSSAVFRLARQVHFGGRRPILIELLDRCLQYFCRRAGNAFVRGELHALEHFAAAHDKYVDDRAGRSHVQAEGIPVAQADGRNFLLAIAKRLHRSRGVAKVRGFLEPFSRRPRLSSMPSADR